jgi:hypothetical protein
MKSSTVLLVFGILGLGGVGVYLYLKNKKTPKLGSVADDTLGLTPKDDTKLLSDLGVKVEEPKATPYVKPIEGVPLLTAENLQKALLSLNIDQTRSITELSSPNYKEAQSLASKIKYISSISVRSGNVTLEQGKTISEYYGSTVGFETNCQTISTVLGKRYVCNDYRLRISKDDILKNMIQKLNALGYKVLPNYDIEKM